MRAIRAKKPLDGRKPRYHKILIPICIRGRVLWFVNDARCVTFAYQSHNLHDLSWFLHQLNDDIQEVVAEGAPGRAPRQPDTATVEQQDLQKCKKILLDNLKEYPPCRSAFFLNTKLVIRVARVSDGQRKEFGICSTSCKRFRTGDWDFEESFANLEARIRAWLRAPVGHQAPALPLPDTEYYDPMDAGADPPSPNGEMPEVEAPGLASGSADVQISPGAAAVADAAPGPAVADAAPWLAVAVADAPATHFLDLDETQVPSSE